MINKYSLIFLLFIFTNTLLFAQNTDKIIDSSFINLDIYNSPLPNNNVTQILFSKTENARWVSTWGGGVTKWSNNKWVTYNSANTKQPISFINEMALDHSNNLWLATNKKGLIKYDGKRWKHYDIGSTNTLLTLAVDKDNAIWIGTYDDGLYKLQNDSIVKMWGRERGLKYAVQAICFDKENQPWISTNKGIYQWQEDKFILRKIDTTIKKQAVQFAIQSDSRGNIWCAGFPIGTIQKWDGHTWIQYEESAQQALQLPKGKVAKQIDPTKQYFKMGFYIDDDDNIYLPTQYNGAIAKFNGRKWTAVIPANGQYEQYGYACITKDDMGKIYCGTWNHGILTYDKVERIPDNKIVNYLDEINGRKVMVDYNLEVPCQEIKLEIWDQGFVDGDIITLYVNDSIALKDFEITATRQTVMVNLVPNVNNKITVYANNTGKIAPNTSAIMVTCGKIKQRYILNSDMKRCAAINFTIKQ